MPLLEINQNRHICASVRLDEVTATQVDQYAAFIHASADDVVDKALNYVFSKDRDFQDFLKTAHAKQVAPLCVCEKARAMVRRSSRQRSLQTGSSPRLLYAREGMIVHSISWWCKNGASHRKNFDTPPLIGSCRYTTVNVHIKEHL